MVGWLAGFAPGLVLAASPPVRAVVTVAPLSSLLRSLGGEQVEVQVLLPPGRDVETTAARPRDLRKLERAELVWWIGSPAFVAESRTVAPWLRRHPGVAAVALADPPAAGLVAAPRSAGVRLTHSHESASSADPHLWLSPRAILTSLSQLETALGRLRPHSTARFAARRSALEERIGLVSEAFRQLVRNGGPRSFLVHHPSLGALAAEFGLEQYALEDHGREPTARQLLHRISWCRQERIRSVLVVRGTRPSSVRVLERELGLRPIEVDLFEEDWFTLMEGIRQALVAALERG